MPAKRTNKNNQKATEITIDTNNQGDTIVVEGNNDQVTEVPTVLEPTEINETKAEDSTPVKAEDNGTGGALDLPKKEALVRQQAEQMQILLLEEDVKTIAKSLKTSFKSQHGFIRAINKALIAYQQQLNEMVNSDNDTTLQALTYLRKQQNQKANNHFQALKEGIDTDCQQWERMASFANDLFGEVDFDKEELFALPKED